MGEEVEKLVERLKNERVQFISSEWYARVSPLLLTEAAATLQRLQGERDEAVKDCHTALREGIAYAREAGETAGRLTAAEAQVEALKAELNAELDSSIQASRQVEAMRKVGGSLLAQVDVTLRKLDGQLYSTLMARANEFRAALASSTPESGQVSDEIGQLPGDAAEESGGQLPGGLPNTYEGFALRVARVEHSQDEGFNWPEPDEPDDARAALDMLVAEARNLISRDPYAPPAPKAAAPAEARSVEAPKPIAWIMRDWAGGKIDVTLNADDRDIWERRGFEIQPLYALPTPPKAEGDQ